MTSSRPEPLSLDGSWDFIPDPERRHSPGRLPHGEPIIVPGAWEAMLESLVQRASSFSSRRFT